MADLSLVVGALDGVELKTGWASPLTTSAKERGGGVGIPCWDSGVSGTTEHPRSLLSDPDLGGMVGSDSAWGTAWEGAACVCGALFLDGDGQAAAEVLGALEGRRRRRGGGAVTSGGWETSFRQVDMKRTWHHLCHFE